MKQKNKKKYLLFIPIIVIVILLFSTIYFIDLMKFNKNHKDYDETYMIKMMYLVADEKITSKEDTISDVADYDNDKALFAINEIIPLEKKDDYLYADLSEFTNDKLLENTTDVIFAKNNDFGEVIDGCSYDAKTKTLKVPFSYYENIGEYEVPIESQILSLLSIEDLMSMEVDVSTKNFVTNTRKIGADNFSMTTNIPLYNTNISADDLDVYVNNSGYSIQKEFVAYDKDTSILTLYMPAILIDKVDIKVNKPILPSVSAVDESSAATASQMNAIQVADRPNIDRNGYKIVDTVFYKPGGTLDSNTVNAVTCHDYNNGSNMGVKCRGGAGTSLTAMNIDRVSDTTNNPFIMAPSSTNYTMYYSYIGHAWSGTNDKYSYNDINSADANTKFYKTDYSVSSTYAMRLSVFDSSPTFTSGSDFVANKNNDEYKNNSPRILQFKDNTFNLLALEEDGSAAHGGNGYGSSITVSANDMKNYWISLHCVSGSASAQSANFYFKLSNVYEDSNSMVVKIALLYGEDESVGYINNDGTNAQGAIGYVKFVWQNKCRVKPRKLFAPGSKVTDGSVATFRLYDLGTESISDRGGDGQSCPGTFLEEKSVEIKRENIFNDGEYYSLPDGAFGSELTIGHIYCMEEVSFKDPDNNELLTHDYVKYSADTPGYLVDDFAAVDNDNNANGEGMCDDWPGIVNRERKYCTSIKKTDKETGVALRGVNFSLNGSGSYTTNNNGVYTWTHLKYGTYTAKEITSSGTSLTGTDNKSYEYFNDDNSNIALTLTEETYSNGTYTCPTSVSTVTHTDTKVYYCLKVKKVDYVTKAPLEGAEFTATNGTLTINKNSSDYATSGGITSFFIGDSSRKGNWTVTETKAPDGYTIDTASKAVVPIALKKYNNISEARTACLNSNQSAVAMDGNTVASKTYNSNNGNNDYVRGDKKILINWYKTTENGSTKIDGAKFVVKNSSGKYITVSNPVSIKDSSSNGVTKACYQYTGTTTNYNNAGIMIAGNKGNTTLSMTGEACVSGLPSGNYTVEEIEAPEYHTFNNTSSITITAGNVFANISPTNKLVNYPTEFKFTKEVSNSDGTQEGDTKYTITIGGETKTVSLSEMTTEELKKIGFTIYDSNGNPVPVKEISSGKYEYGSNSVDQKGTASNTNILHLDDNRQIDVQHLPKGNYSIKEVDTSSCQLSNGAYGTSLSPESRPTSAPSCSNGGSSIGGSGSGDCIGYYSPDYSSDAYRFIINDCSSTNASSNSMCSSDGGIEIKSLTNIPTEITFTKKDLYSYQDASDVIDNNREQNSSESSVEFEDAKERSDFDRIDFKVKDSNGNYLNFIYVGNNGTCSNDSDYSVYRYVPGLALPSDVDPNVFNYHANGDGLTVTQTLHACGGHIKLINLCRGETYTFEEVKVPDDSVYVLQKQGDLNPEVCFEIPCSTNEEEHRTSTTAVINDKPTRVTFEKKDAKYNYLIPDPVTTFEVYRCPKENGNNTLCNPSAYSTVNEREAAGMKLIKFEPRTAITGDEEDPGIEVYRMMSDSDSKNKTECQNNQTSNCYVTSVHPDAGRLVLRYLQSGYNYVLLETVAPTNYVLPTGTDAETPFTVVNTTVDVEEVNVPNSPTAIIIRKYADQDGDNKADSGKLLGGAKFRVYKVTNYNANKKVKDQEKELVKLKTIKDGIYEDRPVQDTDVITTCSGDNCSYNPESLGYLDTPWENIDDLIEKSGSNIKSVLKEGTALIQYLEYDTYYIIEEIEAPTGYSLPEKDDDRFTLVHIKENETEILDTQDALVNKPTSFTFYKFDEYNTPLDGATFYLQKLDNNKKYNTLTVSKETLDNGKIIYRADKNSEQTEITTSGGQATVYYLEPGQYRILEVKAAEGYELPKKTINVATFFVDEDGMVYGNNIITNKKPSETIEYLASDQAELIINIQTGKVVIKYGLIITLLICSIVGLIIFLKKRK